MSTSTGTAPRPASPGTLHRLSLATYHDMIRLGLLKESDRVVLLDGLLVNTMAKGVRHTSATRRIFLHLFRHLPEGWTALKEDPILLPDGPEGPSEPEPDVTVVAGTADDFDGRHPSPGDIALVVEIADTSLADDRKMLARYGWAGIPRVWIVDLNGEAVTIASCPTGPGPDPGFASVVVVDFSTDLIVGDREGRELVALRPRDVLKAGDA